MNVRFLIYEHLNGNPISDLNLSERAYNCLMRGGIHTVGDLLNNMERIPRLKACGAKTVNEIKNALIRYERDNSPNPKKFNEVFNTSR